MFLRVVDLANKKLQICKEKRLVATRSSDDRVDPFRRKPLMRAVKLTTVTPTSFFTLHDHGGELLLTPSKALIDHTQRQGQQHFAPFLAEDSPRMSSFSPLFFTCVLRNSLPNRLRLRPCPQARRCLATAAAEMSSPEVSAPPPAAPSDPRISRIVDDISGLTLLQAADLVTQLKVPYFLNFSWRISAYYWVLV